MSDFTGRMLLPSRHNGKMVLRFCVNEDVGDLAEYTDKDLNLKISIQREGRSLSANAYFHVLVEKIRQVLCKDSLITFAHVKNQLICDYGQVWLLDGKAAVYKTNIPPEIMCEQEEPHAKLFRTGEDGAYWYRLYRGSHTYDTNEMYRLIQGTIETAKGFGIETKTPDELARMEGLYDAVRAYR